MQFRYIAIEGNIGSGKSTLANLLANHFNARIILEEFEDNTFLPKFYEEPARYAFPLELSFLADRYNQLKKTLLVPELFSENIVSDYVFTKSKLFARINLQGNEYELFQKLFDIIDLQLPAPDLLIFLHAPVAKLQDNIRKRGRAYEKRIPDAYLGQVADIYQQYLRVYQFPVLTIDTTETDFLHRPADFARLVRFIHETEPSGQNRFTL